MDGVLCRTGCVTLWCFKAAPPKRAFYLSKNLIVSIKPLKNCHLKTQISGSEKQIINWMPWMCCWKVSRVWEKVPERETNILKSPGAVFGLLLEQLGKYLRQDYSSPKIIGWGDIKCLIRIFGFEIPICSKEHLILCGAFLCPFIAEGWANNWSGVCVFPLLPLPAHLGRRRRDTTPNELGSSRTGIKCSLSAAQPVTSSLL